MRPGERRWAVLLLLGAAPLAACWGTTPTPPSPPDVTPPVVEARPPGGAHGAVAYVTLVADEIATIEYTLDGSVPATGGPGTRTGSNPVFWLRMGDGETTLRFRAIDAAGNASQVWTETYLVDSRPPVLEQRTPDPAPIGLLGEAQVTWRASEPVNWVASVAAAADPGAWLALAEGQAQGGVDVTVRVARGALPGATCKLRVEARDPNGHTGSLDVPLAAAVPEPVHSATTSQGYGELALSADGRRAYIMGGQAIVAVDLDHASPSFGAQAWSYDGLWYPQGLALEPGGERLWVAVTSNAPRGGPARFVALDPATGAERASLEDPRAEASYHLVAQPWGRLHVQHWFDGVLELDADPASPGFGTTSARWPLLRGSGPLEVSPDRRHLLHLPAYQAEGQVGLLVIDPGAADYGLVWGTLAGRISPYLGAAAWAPDGASLVLGGCPTYPDCALQRYTLATDALGPKVAAAAVSALAFVPSGEALLAVAEGPALEVRDPSDLRLLATLHLGEWLSGATRVATSPDGAAALVLGYGPALEDRLVRVMLR